MVQHGTDIGVDPAGYDTTLLANTAINVNDSGRQWTY